MTSDPYVTIRHVRPVCMSHRSSLIPSFPTATGDGLQTSLSAGLRPVSEAPASRAAGRLGMSEGFAHVPVMLDEVLEVFDEVDDGVLVDATVGGAGHARALLDVHPRWDLVALDRDPDAVRAATQQLAVFRGRATVHRARFDELVDVVRASPAATTPVVAVLFDLGVSSHQLDVAERGFSYRNDGPLDMRMDPADERSAYDIVNGDDEETLAELFAMHGEERFAKRIARAIVAQRPIASTASLAEIVADAVPAAARRRGHPARRVFQALRVSVNSELELLGPALDDAISLLAPGGRTVVLAYHSGEDRLVKERFRFAATGGCVCPPGLPCVCGAEPTVRLLNRGARLASAAEIESNPRAESVRMRAVERLGAPRSWPSRAN
ncbi:MAG: mraW [Acidimicrobiaceae bacterium]|nr:mraW [Acidimicrobiaceae bacterium]